MKWTLCGGSKAPRGGTSVCSRSRKEEGTQGAVVILREKTRVQSCVSQNSDRRDTPEILRIHLVQNWILERKGQSGGVIQKGELHERNPCAPKFEERTPEEASRQADCDSKVAWNLARKNAHAEQERFKLRWHGYFEKVQKPFCGTDRDWWSANKRGSTRFCSWSRSGRNSAITRWNASGSIASYAFLKTRISIWMEKTVKLPLTKDGKTITWKMDNFVHLVVPGLSSSSGSISASTSRQKDQSNYSRKLGTLSDPVTTWSDKHACEKLMLTDPDKQATGNREPTHEFFFRRDRQGGSNARHSWLVTALHR